MDVRALRRFHDFLVGGVEPAVEDVFPDRRVEEVDVLLDDADVPPDRFHCQRVDFLPVEQNLTVGDVVEVRDEVTYRGLTAAGGSDEREGLTFVYLQRHVAQNLLRAVIRVADVREGDVPGELSGVLRAVDVLFGLRVHYFDKPLEPGDAVLVLLHEVDERHDRRDEDADRHDEGRIVAERDFVIIEKQSARDEHDDVEDIGDEAGSGVELTHSLVRGAPRADELPVSDLEFFGFLFGIGEGFGDADAGDRGLESGVDLGDRLAALLERVAHLDPQRQRDDDEERHAREDDEGQRHVYAYEVAEQTLSEVKAAMKINYFDDVQLINAQSEKYSG